MKAFKKMLKKFGVAMAVALTGVFTFGVTLAGAAPLHEDIAVTDATALLTALGILGVIVIAATIGLAAVLYRRFKH